MSENRSAETRRRQRGRRRALAHGRIRADIDAGIVLGAVPESAGKDFAFHGGGELAVRVGKRFLDRLAEAYPDSYLRKPEMAKEILAAPDETVRGTCLEGMAKTLPEGTWAIGLDRRDGGKLGIADVTLERMAPAITGRDREEAAKIYGDAPPRPALARAAGGESAKVCLMQCFPDLPLWACLGVFGSLGEDGSEGECMESRNWKALGPYGSLDEANAALFPANAKRKFGAADGKGEGGCHAADGPEGIYMAPCVPSGIRQTRGKR